MLFNYAFVSNYTVINSLKKTGDKSIIIYLILIIIFSHLTNLFYNTYFILKNDYEKRLVFHYGNCGKESYGYLSSINKKFKINENINVINKEDYPSSKWFFYKVNRPTSNEYLIMLNYKNKVKFLGGKNYLTLNGSDPSRYEIIDNYENCFFLKKI